MRNLFLLPWLAVVAAGLEPGLGLVGFRPNQGPEIFVTLGTKVVGSHRCEAVGGYVAAWHAFALIVGNELSAFDGRKCRKVLDIGWIVKGEPEWVFAVSPDGNYLADYDAVSSTLRVWSLKERKLRFAISARSLSKSGFGVDRGDTYDLRVRFSPTGDAVFCTFPKEEEPDGGDYVRPVTVKISVQTKRASIVGIGSPVGWVGNKLVRVFPIDVYVGLARKTMPEGGLYGTNGHMVFGAFNRHGVIRIQAYGPKLAPIAPRYDVAGLPVGFTVEDLVPYPSK